MEMKEIKYEVLKKGSLVKSVSIKNIKPCIATEGKVRVLMELDSPLGEVLPLLASTYPPGKTSYLEKKKILTLSLFNRLITIYPSGKVTMNKTLDKEDAIEVISHIMKDINQLYDHREEADSSEHLKSPSKLGPLDIHRCLPQTNCTDCGESTCMAFAFKILSGEQKLNNCIPLHEPWNQEQLKCLKKILGSTLMQNLGWEGY